MGSDQLQRHINIHDPNYVAESYPSILQRSGRRTLSACQNCAASKTKCDGSSPCARCISRNIDCVFRQSARREKRASCYTKPPVAAKKASKLMCNIDESSQSTSGNYNETSSQQPAVLKSMNKSPLPQRITGNSTPEPVTLNVGISDLDVVSQEQPTHLEDLLDIDWSSEFQRPSQGLQEDLGSEESKKTGAYNSKRSTPLEEENLDSDNVDQYFNCNPTHTLGTLSSDHAKAKEQLITESPNYGTLHSQIHDMIPNCSGNADWNTVSAFIVDGPMGLDHEIALNIDTKPQAGLSPLPKAPQTDGNLFNFRDGRLETLLGNLHNVLLMYSPATDGESSMESPCDKNGDSDSISMYPEDMLEECIRTFAFRFDRMFPLLEDGSPYINAFSKTPAHLGRLLIVTMVTQTISSIPSSRAVSETSMHLTQACSAPILQAIQPKALSIATEIILHLCLIHAYQLLWITPRTSGKGFLDTYYMYLSKVRGVYLDDSPNLTTNRGTLPLTEDSSVHWSQWKTQERKRR